MSVVIGNVSRMSFSEISRIEGKLNADEVFSLIFLLIDDAKDALNDCLSYNDNCRSRTPIHDWAVLQNKLTHNWKEKFCEALSIIEHYNTLENKFGLPEKEVSDRYLPKNFDTSLYISRFRKQLYLLIENLNDDECEKLVNIICADHPLNDNQMKRIKPIYLEIYLLYWMTTDVISTKNISILESALIKFNQKDLLTYIAEYKPKVLNEKEYYDTSSSTNIGKVLIINQKNFGGYDEEWSSRVGTDVDRNKLEETFKMFGYTVNIAENLTAQALITQIAYFSYTTVTKDDLSAIICVLSHGQKDHVMGVDGTKVPIEMLQKPFYTKQCLKLQRKPKLYFIQACQGEHIHRVASAPIFSFESSTDDAADGPLDIPNVSFGAADLSDFLTYYSSVPGYVSFRNQIRGSQFIDSVCKNLILHCQTKDVSSIIPAINDHASSKIAVHKGQVCTGLPQFNSTLCKLIRFNFSKEGVIEATVLKIQRALFHKLMDKYLRLYIQNEKFKSFQQ